MEEQEAIHYLKILVELQLFPILREEINLKDPIDIEQQRQIIRFINELPEEYRKIENRDEIIADTLKRMGMNISWVEKKIEEVEMMKKMKASGITNTTVKEKSHNNEIEKE